MIYCVNPQWQDPEHACLFGAVSPVILEGQRSWNEVLIR